MMGKGGVEGMLTGLYIYYRDVDAIMELKLIRSGGIYISEKLGLRSLQTVGIVPSASVSSRIFLNRR